MEAKPKRRWFQFSLRTLMIVVALLAVPMAYVGWQAKIVRERKATAMRLYDLGGSCMKVSEYRSMVATGWNAGVRVEQIPEVSWFRRWLGDEAVVGIFLSWKVEESVEAEIIRAFPEALISRNQLMN